MHQPYEQPNVTPERSILSSLQAGGYILYARHAEATVGIDQPNLSFQYCYTQRNLSQRGKSQAVTYGETMRRLQIPVMTPVLASPFCRTIETAVLAFGEENVGIDPYWLDIYNLSLNLPLPQQANILSQLYAFLEVPPASGTNRVIIAHSFPQGVGLGAIPNMGTVVVRPLGTGNGFEVVDQLTFLQFTRLES